MKLPWRVWVKGRTHYLVVWVDGFDSDSDTSITRGECCDKAKHIYIRRGMSSTETIETFIHEFFHCIEFEYKLPIPHKLIYRLERIICKILVKNGIKIEAV